MASSCRLVLVYTFLTQREYEMLLHKWRSFALDQSTHIICIADFVHNWGNHLKIFAEAGLVVERYRYYDRSTNGLNLKGTLEDIVNAPDKSVILLHACAHNPTGCDPTHEKVEGNYLSCTKEAAHCVFRFSLSGIRIGKCRSGCVGINVFCIPTTSRLASAILCQKLWPIRCVDEMRSFIVSVAIVLV